VAKKGKDNSDPKPGKKTGKVAAPKATTQTKAQKKPATDKKPPRANRKPLPATKPEPVRTKTSLTSKELAHFQALLLAKRAELIGDVNCMEDEALQKSKLSASGDLSTMPIHMADIGTANYEQEFALGLLDGERKMLHEINEALQRIEDKTYGICDGTGKEISKARLEANPWARYCVEYARMLEQGLVKEGESYVEGDDDQEDVLDEEDVLGDEDSADDADDEPEAAEETPIADEEEEPEDNGLDWRGSKD
jgi:DnaK suppressor protein